MIIKTSSIIYKVRYAARGLSVRKRNKGKIINLSLQ